MTVTMIIVVVVEVKTVAAVVSTAVTKLVKICSGGNIATVGGSI